MFERLLGQVKTPDCWKILIECVEDISEQRILNYSGVYTVQIKFDYSSFICKSDFEKKKQVLELIMEGVKIVSNHEGWNLEPFEEVGSKIVESNYENKWIWKKPVKSKNKKISAEIICYHAVKNIDIYIVLKDKTGQELVKKKIISELPNEFAYSKHLGKIKWISDSQVVLVNQNGDNEWSVNLNNLE